MGLRIRFRRLTAPSGRPSPIDEPAESNTKSPDASTPVKRTGDGHPMVRSRSTGDVDDQRSSSDSSSGAMTRLEHIWEAEDFVRRFVLDGWGQYVLDQATIQCDMTLRQLRRIGRMPQTDGVRACRRLVRVPVLCDEVAYRLWASLGEAEEEESEEEEGDEADTAGMGDGPPRRPEHDMLNKTYTLATIWRAPRPAIQPAAAVYTRCWNCGGLCKRLGGAVEEGEEEAAPRTLFRCMECSRVLEARLEATSSDESEEDDRDDERDCELKDYKLSKRISRALRRRGTTRSSRPLTDGEDACRRRRGSLLLSSRASIASSLQLVVSTVAENLANGYGI
ncbi:hypothetical protein RB595_002337 [Gaeumannomyces hyphopodioides]